MHAAPSRGGGRGPHVSTGRGAVYGNSSQFRGGNVGPGRSYSGNVRAGQYGGPNTWNGGRYYGGRPNNTWYGNNRYGNNRYPFGYGNGYYSGYRGLYSYPGLRYGLGAAFGPYGYGFFPWYNGIGFYGGNLGWGAGYRGYGYGNYGGGNYGSGYGNGGVTYYQSTDDASQQAPAQVPADQDYVPQLNNTTAELAAGASGGAVLGITLDPQYPSAAVVRTVTPGAPAERAGLRAGDMITQIDSKQMQSFSDVVNLIGGMQPGAQVAIQFVRPILRSEVQAAAPEPQPGQQPGQQPTQPQQTQPQQTQPQPSAAAEAAPPAAPPIDSTPAEPAPPPAPQLNQ
jgi:hypothetical protein